MVCGGVWGGAVRCGEVQVWVGWGGMWWGVHKQIGLTEVALSSTTATLQSLTDHPIHSIPAYPSELLDCLCQPHGESEA